MMKHFAILCTLLLAFTLFSKAQAPIGINYQGIARDLSGNPQSNQRISLRMSIVQGGINGNTVYSEVHDVTTNAFGLFTLVVGEGNTSDNFGVIEWSDGDMWMQVEMDITGGSNYQIIGSQQFLSVPYALFAVKSGIGLEADEGIEISGGKIRNTLPDQQVQLLGAGSISINGTYPNYTITGLDRVEDDDADPANEIQDLELNNNQLRITNNSEATTIDLGAYELSENNDAGGNTISNVGTPVNDSDAATKGYVDNLHSNDLDQSATNEIQDLNDVLNVNNDAGGVIIENIGSPVNNTDAVNKEYVDNLDNADLDKSATNEIQSLTDVLSEGNSAGNNRITNLATPTSNNDATTKVYVDDIRSELLGVINDEATNYAFSVTYTFQNTTGVSTNDRATLSQGSGDFVESSVISGNRFTAPVSGVYFISIQGESEDNLSLSLLVNGDELNPRDTFVQQRFPNATFKNYYGTFLINLAEDDFVELNIPSSGLGDELVGKILGYKL